MRALVRTTEALLILIFFFGASLAPGCRTAEIFLPFAE
jgi:hypothetical protein